jgi:hypothetical protein
MTKTKRSLLPRQSIDGLTHQPLTHSVRNQRRVSRPTAENLELPRRRTYQTSSPPPLTIKKRNKFVGIKNIVTYFSIIILAVAIGTALIDVRIGQWLVVGAGVAALIFRVESRVFFSTTLFFLAMVPILAIVSQQALSENYALYAFIILVIGIMRAVIEHETVKNDDVQPL